MKFVSFRIVDKTNVDSIVSVIKTQNEWFKMNDTTFMVGGSLTAKELRNLLMPFKPSFLVVIPFSYYSWYASNIPDDVQRYLDKNMSYDD